VAHPDVEQAEPCAILAIEQTIEQFVGRAGGDFRVAEFAMVARQHLATQLLAIVCIP